MQHFITCHGRIMPRLAALLLDFSHVVKYTALILKLVKNLMTNKSNISV